MNKYRTAFRKKVIPKYYKGSLHVALFSLIQVTAIIFLGVKLTWNLTTIFVILGALIYATTFTYFLHRFLLHKKVPGFHWAHKMHHWHHTFYQSQEMEYDELDDVYMLLMPPWIQVFYYAVYLPFLTLIVGSLISIKFVLPFVFGLTLWYGIYELVHWMEHLPVQHMCMKLPFMKTMRRNHQVHHSKLKDEANFGIVEPSWDYLFGTQR